MTSPSQRICTGWIGVDDLRCDTGTPEQQADAISVASELLFEYSGRQYAGHCRETLVFQQGIDDCSRNTRHLKLGAYPVTNIVGVEEDGSVVDPALYQVNKWRILERLQDPDGSWPTWRLDLGVEVEFDYGLLPPPDGEEAANALACELLKGWVDGADDCAYGEQVSSLQRQGVSLDFLVLRPEEYRDGFLGIKAVDRFIGARNPGRLRRRAKVGNPDLRRLMRRDT